MKHPIAVIFEMEGGNKRHAKEKVSRFLRGKGVVNEGLEALTDGPNGEHRFEPRYGYKEICTLDELKEELSSVHCE